jgi:hypothetical protein
MVSITVRSNRLDDLVRYGQITGGDEMEVKNQKVD